MNERPSPMPLAEAAECCGQPAGYTSEQQGSAAVVGFARAVGEICDNCPLLIERKRTDVLRHARAM